MIQDLTVAAGIVHEFLALDDRDVECHQIGRGACSRGLGGRDFRLDRRQLQCDADVAWCVDAGQLGGQRFRRGGVARGLARDSVGDDEALLRHADRCRLRTDVEPSRERLDVASQARLVEQDAGGDVHAPNRGSGVENDPFDRVAGTSDRHRLAHEAIDVRAAVDVGVLDHHLDVATRQDRATFAHRGERRLEPRRRFVRRQTGELDPTDSDAGQDPPRVGPIERVERPDTDDQAHKHAQEERDEEARPRVGRAQRRRRQGDVLGGGQRRISHEGATS